MIAVVLTLLYSAVFGFLCRYFSMQRPRKDLRNLL